MQANELYDQLNNDITTAIEILISLPKILPDITGKYKEGKPLSQIIRSGLWTDEQLFTSQLFCLMQEINRSEKLVAGSTSSKEGLSEVLNSFHSNKGKIIIYFESVIDHPELRIYYGYEQYYTLEGQLRNAAVNIQRESKRVQENFEKLIMTIDSES